MHLRPFSGHFFGSLLYFRLFFACFARARSCLLLQTIDSLVAASDLPLSVVIVGVGRADFAVSWPASFSFLSSYFLFLVSLHMHIDTRRTRDRPRRCCFCVCFRKKKK